MPHQPARLPVAFSARRWGAPALGFGHGQEYFLGADVAEVQVGRKPAHRPGRGLVGLIRVAGQAVGDEIRQPLPGRRLPPGQGGFVRRGGDGQPGQGPVIARQQCGRGRGPALGNGLGQLRLGELEALKGIGRGQLGQMTGQRLLQKAAEAVGGGIILLGGGTKAASRKNPPPPGARRLAWPRFRAYGV